MKTVFICPLNQKHDAIILHEEENLFGAYISSTGELVVGHPKLNIAKEDNIQVIFSYDHKLHLDKLFNSSGDADSYVFNYFDDPNPIISYLKTVRLLSMR